MFICRHLPLTLVRSTLHSVISLWLSLSNEWDSNAFVCIHKMISFLNFSHSKLRRSSGFYYNRCWYIVSTYCESCANITVFFSADTYDIRTYNGIGWDSKKIYILWKFFGIFNIANRWTWICIRFAWKNFIAGWVRVWYSISILHSDRNNNPLYDVKTFIESLLLT